MNGPRRVHIDRLELDLRGISAETAEAAARALAPALAQVLAGRGSGIASAGRVDAGRIASTASPVPSELATGIAQRIANTVARMQSGESAHQSDAAPGLHPGYEGTGARS